MDKPTTKVLVNLNADEAAILDEKRGSTPRAVYLRRLLHSSVRSRDVATRTEALALLSEQARAGRTAAAVALARELREDKDEGVRDWIMNGHG